MKDSGLICGTTMIDILLKDFHILILTIVFLKKFWSTMAYNLILVLGVQQSDSGTHIHIYTIFPIWVLTNYWVYFPVL